jgi:hypothetical protein
MKVYVLFEEDDQTGEMQFVGVFSSLKTAEKVQEEWDRMYTNRYPIKYEIQEHQVNYHFHRVNEILKEMDEL